MTKSQMIEEVLKDQKDEYGADLSNPKVREYAELFTEDLIRKGCIPETFDRWCRECGSCVNGECPLVNWETRHPEFVDDDLTKKIKALETELYGWHKPVTQRIETVSHATVKELIAKLQEMPEGTTVEVCQMKIPLNIDEIG